MPEEDNSMCGVEMSEAYYETPAGAASVESSNKKKNVPKSRKSKGIKKSDVSTISKGKNQPEKPKMAKPKKSD